MGKNKLKKFDQYNTFDNTFDARNQLKGKWHSEVFKNNNPITLELACGRGEYTVGLARLFPDRNFVGVDVKASRMWQGAKYAIASYETESGLKLRLYIFMKNNLIHELKVERE